MAPLSSHSVCRLLLLLFVAYCSWPILSSHTVFGQLLLLLNFVQIPLMAPFVVAYCTSPIFPRIHFCTILVLALSSAQTVLGPFFVVTKEIRRRNLTDLKVV